MRYAFFLALAMISFSDCTNKTNTMKTSDLENTYWILSEMDGLASVPAEMRSRPAFIRFADSGRVSFSVGCNNMMGTYKMEEGKFDIKTGPSTMMACPEPLMTLERAYAQLLSEVDRYHVKGDKLQVQKGDAVLATFTKGGEQ